MLNKPKKKISNKSYPFKGNDSAFSKNQKKQIKNVLDVPVWIRIVRVFKKDFRG